MFIGVQSGEVAAAGAPLQQRDEVGHQGQLLLRAGAPTEFQRGEQFGELFAVENHAVQDVVDKRLERFAPQAVRFGRFRNLRGVLLVLEPLVGTRSIARHRRACALPLPR